MKYLVNYSFHDKTTGAHGEGDIYVSVPDIYHESVLEQVRQSIASDIRSDTCPSPIVILHNIFELHS